MQNPYSTQNGPPAEATISPYATTSLKSVLAKILPPYATHLISEVVITAKEQDTVTIVAPPLVIDFAEHDDTVAKFFWPKKPIWVKAPALSPGAFVMPIATTPEEPSDVLEHLRMIEMRILKMETNMQRLIAEALPEPSPGYAVLETENDKLRYENSQLRTAVAQAYEAIRYWL